MKVLFLELPKYPWWGSGTPVYENNWAMKAGVIPNQKLVEQEHASVQQALTTHTDLNIIPFPQELDANGLNKHDAIFLRDNFISNQQGDVVVSRFAEKERQAETAHIERYLKKQGFRLHYLPYDAYAEGGEFFYCLKDNVLFAGISRNNKKGTEETAKLLAVDTLFIVESDSFHLDTVFSVILNNEGKLIGVLACLPLIKNGEALRGFVQRHNIELIQINPDDAIDFDGNGRIAVNCLPLPGKLIGGSTFHTPGIEEKLKQMNIEHVVAPITQFLYSGGGVHCLTNELLF